MMSLARAGAPLAIGINLVWLGEGAAGVGRYATELLRSLREVEPENRIVAFVSRDVPQELLDAPWSSGVEWVRFPVRLTGPPLHLAAQFAALPAAALRRRLDVLHHPSGVGPVRTPRIATVVTLLDLIWLHEADRWADRRAQRSIGLLQRHTARHADRFVAISGAVRDDFAATFGLDGERIDVTHLGVRPPADSVAATSAEGLRARHGIGQGPVVLCVAQKRPYKNLPSLVRALAALDVEDAQLVLPGAPTEHEAELRALCAELGVAGRVHFPAWVSDADLEGLYRMASCFVLPSLIEGFGIPVLEAMSRGVPVACSNRASLPEVAGDAALLFDPEDQAAVTGAVRRLLTDRGQAERLAVAGRERAGAFTWARTAEATLASYRRALAARGRRRERR